LILLGAADFLALAFGGDAERLVEAEAEEEEDSGDSDGIEVVLGEDLLLAGDTDLLFAGDTDLVLDEARVFLATAVDFFEAILAIILMRGWVVGWLVGWWLIEKERRETEVKV
jgi:hypothetical protein